MAAREPWRRYLRHYYSPSVDVGFLYPIFFLLFYAEEKGRGDVNACIISSFQSLNCFKNGVFIRMKVATKVLFKRYRRYVYNS
jgi:hypothetical protein